jgi:hypothetical protein
MSLKPYFLILTMAMVLGCTGPVTPADEASVCNDTDGGMNGNIKGKVTLTSGLEQKVFEDTCLNTTTVMEYYCDNGNVSGLEIECGAEYACENAACARQPCVRSTQQNGPGITSKGQNRFADTCSGASGGTEYYCEDDGGIGQRPFACPPGTACSDGKCMQALCTDSDGRDSYTKGNVTAGENVYEDTCTSLTVLKEYYCDGNLATYEAITCKAGCNAGRCAKIASGCTETDGGRDIYNEGSLMMKTGLIEAEYLDKCVDNDTVKEYYCTEDGYTGEIVDCPAGLRCVQAGCREELCVDTDEYNINRKGVVTKGTERADDTCTDTTGGIEYVCEGNNMTAKAFKCPSGSHCADGACK